MAIAELQAAVRNKDGFLSLESYVEVCTTFLALLAEQQLTRIVSPSSPNYIFFQYDASQGHRITRPINKDLFCEDPEAFAAAVQRFLDILDVLRSPNSDSVG